MSVIAPITSWCNVKPSLPVAVPAPKGTKHGQEVERLRRLLPGGCCELNESTETMHSIPADLQDLYRRSGRPTPLTRARRLEEHLGTRSRIYLKREDVIPTGSFKLNTALAQARQARIEGFDTVVTETGAGQWGLALSAACALNSLGCVVFMARCSYEQKADRRRNMELFGTEVHSSPSRFTRSGTRLLEGDSAHPGSIGTAISDAIEYVLAHDRCAYAAGSNFPFVYVHQSVIGLEAFAQMRRLDETPTALVACVGGGSNFAGFVLPQVYGPAGYGMPVRMVGCESAAIPRLTRGRYAWDHGDAAGLTPLVKSYTLGRDFVPPPVHTGGLRQHNGSPMIGALRHAGYMEVRAYEEREILETGRLVSRLEGLLPAPESCHALCGSMHIAAEADQAGREEVIVCCVSGSGTFDIAAYNQE